MTPETRQEMREALEVQYRYSLYCNPAISWLPSLNIHNIIQGFAHEGEYIGTLHLFWDTTKENPYWNSEWLDSATEALELAGRLQQQKDYDEDKLVKANLDHIVKCYGDPRMAVVPIPRHPMFN